MESSGIDAQTSRGIWGPPRKRLSEKGSWRCQKGLHHNKDCTHIVKTSERIMARPVFYKDSSGSKCGEWIWREREDKMRRLVKLGSVWA